MDNLNPSYMVNVSMAADAAGPSVPLANCKGDVTIVAITTATGTPNGAFQLQGSMDGTTWAVIPEATSKFPNSGSAGNIAAGTYAWSFVGLNFEFVRLFYDAASGGVGATISASLRAR